MFPIPFNVDGSVVEKGFRRLFRSLPVIVIVVRVEEHLQFTNDRQGIVVEKAPGAALEIIS